MEIRRNATCCQSGCANSGTIVPAGDAVSNPCGVWSGVGMPMATIMFPIQQYTEGFCPCEALESGTLFPELVM